MTFLLLGSWLLFLPGPASRQSLGGPPPVYDEDVKVVRFADLDHPRSGVLAVFTGVVVVEATLDDDGRVTSASALSGPKALIPECLSNVRKWLFAPNAQRRVIVVYEFTLTPTLNCVNERSVFLFRPPNHASVTVCTQAPQSRSSARIPGS